MADAEAQKKGKARMTLIRRGRRWGFALEEIRQWLQIYEQKGTEAQMQSWIELADRRLDELAHERDQIEQAMQELRQTRDEVAGKMQSR